MKEKVKLVRTGKKRTRGKATNPVAKHLNINKPKVIKNKKKEQEDWKKEVKALSDRLSKYQGSGVTSMVNNAYWKGGVDMGWNW